jgi:hypothetical protein
MGRRTPKLSAERYMHMPLVGRNRGVVKPESAHKLEPQIEFLVGTFLNELAKHLDFTISMSMSMSLSMSMFAAHVRTSLEPHLDPFTSCAPFAAFACSVPNPCSRHANLTFCTCLLAQGWQSTPMVYILNKRAAAGCFLHSCTRGPRFLRDFGRLVLLARSKPLGGARSLSDGARRNLHLRQ